MILGLFVSTVVFFAATFFIKRQFDEMDIPKGMTRSLKFDEMDIPKGMTRSLTIFALALALAYGAAWLVDRLA
jgi:hypothetical protein